MEDGKQGYRYRITLDRNALLIDRVCAAQGATSGDASDAVVAELDDQQGLLQAIKLQ